MEELRYQYKKHYTKTLDEHLEKLAKHHNKNTMQHMFKHLVNVEQRRRNNNMQKKETVSMIEISTHVEWLLSTRSFKHPEKERMAELLCINSNDYIAALAKQYKLKSKNNEDLTSYIQSKYGAKSTAGSALMSRVQFAEDKARYFANKIGELAANQAAFKANHLELLNVFLSRFQTDLNQIRTHFNNHNTHDLHRFIKTNGSGHNTTYFLLKICDNCKRFG